jgi:hypothetical protein
MTLNEIADKLNLFPEVEWDRMAGAEDWRWGGAFGWIARDDGRSDFLVVQWQTLDDGEVYWWNTTSSARYSHDFAERLRGEDHGHQDCQRVEDVLGAHTSSLRVVKL